MIKLIDKTNARVGMCVNVWELDGRIRESKYTITDITPEYVYNNKIGYDFKFHYFSLVSLPERRRLSWDWVKEHIEELPNLKCWNKNEELLITSAGPKYFDSKAGTSTYTECIFIEPPLPEIPETIEPWVVEEKIDFINWSPLLQTPYNSCYCYTSVAEFDCIIKGVSITGGSVSLRSPVKLLQGDKYRVEYNNGQAVIEIIESVKQNPEDKKSLWWVIDDYGTHLNTTLLTRSDAIGLDSNVKIQPYNQESQFGPIDSRWEAVK